MERERDGLGGPVALRPAGFWVRAVAFFIDALAMAMLLALGQWILNSVARAEVWRVAGWFLVAGSVFYKPFLEWRCGRTLGKAILGVWVQDKSGGRISPLQALTRNVVWVLDDLCWALIWVFLFAFSFPPSRFAENWAASLIRGHFVIVLVFWVDIFTICFNREKRALHDFLAGTRCVRMGESPQAPPEEGPGILGDARKRFDSLVKTVGFYGERSTWFLDLWGYLRASDDRDGRALKAPIGESGPLAYDALNEGRTVVLWFPGYVVDVPPRPVGLRFRQDCDTVEAVHAPDGEMWIPLEGVEWSLKKPFYYEFSEAALAAGCGLEAV